MSEAKPNTPAVASQSSSQKRLTSSTQLLESSYFVEEIFPTEDIHMIAGTSGAGKTTWLITFIQQWQRGESIFGYKSFPKPFMYISLDRTLKGLHRTMRRTKVDPATFPHYVPTDNSSLISTIRALKQRDPAIEVFFIDGFQDMVEGNANDNKQVARWLRDLQRLCEDMHVTIVGVGQAPKVKEDDQYVNPRQRISGAAAWAHHMETILILEQMTTSKDQTRQLYLLPRNAPERIFYYDIRDGLLVERHVAGSSTKTNWDKLIEWHGNQPPGTEVTVADLINQTGLARRSLFAELEKPGMAAMLTKIAHGRYRVVAPEPAAEA